ncbi:39S ribosomal protein L46, mitochondrial [Eublepharis macularius]|uniref:Large ribosomal subunit protein mL46 n=1 Tax=Eublepharis macularius TaxID=481883 RepID=A0AA97KNT8_EUBMA|nr:39S ribosomal protein L46, mitochondrial [Eublepharis macularius]
MAAPICRALFMAVPRWSRGACGGCCCRGLSSSALAGSKWRLLGALCLQRPPRVTQAMTPLEKEVAEIVEQMDMEKSMYSDYEIRCLAEEERLQRRKDKLEDDDDSRKEIVLAQDLEDAWEQKLRKFSPAPRLTDADKDGDRTSLNRKLDQNLLLLVKQKVGNQEVWLLPQAEWQDGETLRATAERALVALSGSHWDAKFLGNAPCGFYKYKFPRAVQSDTGVGAKVFFFKALLLQDSKPPLPKGKPDYVWVSKGELADYLKPEYHSQVSQFLVDL